MGYRSECDGFAYTDGLIFIESERDSSMFWGLFAGGFTRWELSMLSYKLLYFRNLDYLISFQRKLRGRRPTKVVLTKPATRRAPDNLAPAANSKAESGALLELHSNDTHHLSSINFPSLTFLFHPLASPIMLPPVPPYWLSLRLIPTCFYDICTKPCTSQAILPFTAPN